MAGPRNHADLDSWDRRCPLAALGRVAITYQDTKNKKELLSSAGGGKFLALALQIAEVATVATNDSCGHE